MNPAPNPTQRLRANLGGVLKLVPDSNIECDLQHYRDLFECAPVAYLVLSPGGTTVSQTARQTAEEVSEGNDGREDRGLFARWENDLSGKAGDERARIVMLEMEARLRRVALGLGAEVVVKKATMEREADVSREGAKGAKVRGRAEW